jgi:hypothetical protein
MTEAEFAAALLDPERPVPESLVRPDGQPAARRFAVYRNNVAIGLTEALRTGFPVVEKLLGPAFFSAMAGTFLRCHPPHNRIMMLYGDRLPDFLASFPPVARYPYLPDVARIEQALRESYHAADVEALPGNVLAATPEAVLLDRRLKLAPSVRLIRSPWPVHSIWCANAEGGPKPKAGPQDVLVLRPGFDPRAHLLPARGGVFMEHLLDRATLTEAIAAAGPDLDLSALLSLLLSGGAITGLE